MSKNRSTYWLTHPDDYTGKVPGPSVPTKGYPGSASDMYRVVGIHTTGHEGWNSCFTDVYTCNALAKIVEGEITKWHEIEAAENALQIIFWHDRLDVIVPAFKVKDTKFAHYIRCDEDRSDLAFDLFKPCDPFDVMYATEAVELRGNKIKRSNYKNSSITGKNIDWAKKNYLSITPIQISAISSVPSFLRVPAYFSHPIIERFHDKRGFSGKFYQSIKKQWGQSSQLVPDIDYSMRLPPLISIVLTRARNRDDIPRIITEIRDELKKVRAEFMTFSDLVKSSFTDVEIEDSCKRIQNSFNATFKASREDKSKILLPILKLYRGFKNPLESVIKILNPSFELSDPHLLANRTVTAKTFSKLLRTDSMHSLLTHFFTKSELNSLELDYQKTQK